MSVDWSHTKQEIHTSQSNLIFSKNGYVPLPISKRKLPALPISKRKLPLLPQSKTLFTSNKCIEEPNSCLVNTTKTNSGNKSLRNLFKKRKSTKNNIKKSHWRPSLQFICNDKQLLNQLITFCTIQYNEENILFLQSVNQLQCNIDILFRSSINIVEQEKINVKITAIYNKYIKHQSEKQINLSSECFRNIMSQHQAFERYSLDQKHSMFHVCVAEIQSLIQISVLNGFYNSQPFQSIANSRNILHNEITDDLFFDYHSQSHWKRHNEYSLSSKGYHTGYHEWKIKILKNNEYRQEFGIVSNFNTKIAINEYGVCDTLLFGARAVYGYNNLNNSFYYASYNGKDNSVRCSKDLSKLAIHDNCFSEGDVVTICLNCDKGKIKFLLNDKNVRKAISVETNTTYYPIILYSGDCKYTVIQ